MSQQTPKFKTKKGEVTVYGLACGYQQLFENKGKEVRLWHEGGPLYHVRLHDFNKGKRIFWDSFEKLGEARKRYNATKREISK